MRRSPLIVSILAAALGCRNGDAPRTAAPVGSGPAAAVDAQDAHMSNVTETNQLQPRRDGRYVAITHGDVAWVSKQGIERWSLSDGKARPAVAVTDRVSALGRDGDGVALVVGDGVTTARLVTIASTGATLADAKAPPRLWPGIRFVTATAANIFAADARNLDVFDRTTGERLHREAFAADELATCTSLDDGVVFYQAGTIVRVGPGAKRASYKASGTALHYAAGPDRDHVWATAADSVSLLGLGTGEAKVEQTAAISGVYHLASVDGDAAVLSVAMKDGAWDTVTVTVVGKGGAVRWSKTLPAPKRAFAEVAGGSGYVAVVLDGALHVFKAADGAAVGP